MRKSREELGRMGREELEEILRLDSQGVGEYSTEDVFYILDVLDRREKEAGEYHVEVDRAWQVFQQDHLLPRKDKKRWWLPRGLGATAAALVLVFVGLLTAQAVGWDILGRFAKWNDEIFTFGSLEPDDPMGVEPEDIDTVSPDQKQEPGIMTPEVLEYDTLQEALDACGITEVKAPTWLPEGSQFQTAERIFDSDAMSYELYAKYECQGELLVINILPSDQSSAYVEKVEGSVDVVDIHGQTIYVIENINNFTIAWETSGYECYLSGFDQQILEQMAASMLN